MGWRAETKEVIRRYPQHCRAEMQLRAVSVTASADGGRAGHSVARTTGRSGGATRNTGTA